MPVQDVEENLSARFERYTGQAIGIDKQESKSLVGVSIVRNFFNPEMDLNTAIAQTTSLVMSVLRKLPPGTQPPLILPFDPMASIPLALVAVSGDMPETQLYDFARYDVRTAIQAVPGAMAPTVMGGAQREIVIFLDPKKLAEYNFSPVEVLSAFSELNTFIPSGDVKIGRYDYQIVSNALVDHIAEMNNFPLRASNGVSVYLNEVGEAKDAGQIQTNVVMIDGKEQVYVPIYRQPGGNSLRVVDLAKAAIKALEQQIHGIKLTVVADQSIFIRHAITSISQEALIGGGLAALMIFLFLNPRAALGVFLSLPLSLLAAFMGLQATNQTINVMTLGGLALSIGVLVDNSIVVLENISKKLAMGRTPHHAALEGTSEVAMPVLSSTLSTLAVLFPVIFLGGIVKILFSALVKSVMFVMIGSFLIAMTVMPLFASRFLHTATPSFQLPWLLARTQGFMSYMTDVYGKALHYAIRHKKLILAGVGCICLGGVLMIPLIGTELFPRADAGNFTLELRLASGTRIEDTTAFAQQIEKKLRQWIEPHDLRLTISNAGVYYGFPAAFTPNTGTQDVFFNIELTEDRHHTTQYYAKIIREHIKQEFPGVDIGVELGGLLTSALNGGLKAPIDVQIQGPDPQKSYVLAQALAEKIKKLRGAVDVRVQQRFDAPTIDVNIDRQKAMDLGITTNDVVKNLVSAVSGSSTFDAQSIWVDPKTGIDYLLGVQFPENIVSSISQLDDIPIKGVDRQRTTTLKEIATISQKKGPTEIDHLNLKPVIDIFLDAQGRDIGGLSEDVIKIIKNTALPENYSIAIRGEIAEMKKSLGLLAGGFILAVALIYLVLMVQFRSFVLPLIIMVSVPLGLVGIIYMLVLSNTYFSIQAAIGAIFMIGIAVANGVLLIEFMTHHVKANNRLNFGIVSGAKSRFRPIIMTSLASILGIIPMAIGVGHGSETNIPLGRAVIGGQLLSTLLTLFVVPILYRIIMQKSHKTKLMRRS